MSPCPECGVTHGPGNTNKLCPRASNYAAPPEDRIASLEAALRGAELGELRALRELTEARDEKARFLRQSADNLTRAEAAEKDRDEVLEQFRRYKYATEQLEKSHERELAEARAKLVPFAERIQVLAGDVMRERDSRMAAEARLAGVAPLLKACASVREISERGDALMSELRTCLTEHVLREILGCAALDAPAEPRCTHEGIGLPGCSTCDPRTKAEGGPR